jgi:hypothetical protein
MVFKIKLEDKAAFLNRMETTDKEISSNQIKDNELEKYFELTVTDPEQLILVKSILNKSPKINTIKEMKNRLTKTELQEMIRQQLQTTLTEKKKMKDEKKKQLDENQLNESVLLAGLATLLGVGGTLVAALVSDLRKAKTKEEKAAVLRRAADTINQKMSGGM